MLHVSPQATGSKRPHCHHRAPPKRSKRLRTNAPGQERDVSTQPLTPSGEAESTFKRMYPGSDNGVPLGSLHRNTASTTSDTTYVESSKTSPSLLTPYFASESVQRSPTISSTYSEPHPCDTSEFRSSPWINGPELFAPCGEPEPCTDPSCLDACPDVVPCHSQEDCNLSGDCFGFPCWGQDCMTDFASQDICCSEECPPETRCDSPPCYSYDCNIPVCESLCPTTGTSTCHGQDSDYQDLCYFPDHHDNSCIPHCGCIDPQCLMQAHVPCDHPHDTALHHWIPQKYRTSGPEVDAMSTDYHSGYFPGSNLHQSQDSSCPTISFSNSSNKPLDSILKHEPFSPQTIESKIQFSLGALAISSEDFRKRPSFQSMQSDVRHEVHQCQWCISLSDSTTRGNSVCGKSFSTSEELHQHVEKIHLDGLPREDELGNGFFCHWEGCDRFLCRSFQARPKLKRHVQTHTLYKPFACSQCGIQMKTKDAMEKHERTHTGERPYECTVPGCGKEFATSTELKTHMTIHEGRKPHQCPICQECFADSSNLSKHKKTHYAGRYVCPDCGARMKRWDQMRRHIATQEHALELLHDKQAQLDYKARMEREFSEMPDKQKIL